MIFTETELPGAFFVDLERREDARGFFARVWCAREFAEQGLSAEVVQCNVTQNVKRGTLRGLHYQVAPHQEVKLVRCTRGAIWDVIVDLRPESSTYKQWLGVELTPENGRMIYVPAGFAHGYQTLEPDTEALYQVSAYYTPEAERGVRWNDPAFGITWPDAEGALLSDKDRNWPDFAG